MNTEYRKESVMDPTKELYCILDECINWNDNYKSIILKYINEGVDLTSIHPKYDTTPLLYGMKRQLHPECIKMLASKGFNKNLKIKYSEYIYDDYVGIDYSITQYKSIKNTLLELYYLSIGENKEEILVELFTERDYVLNKIHYPLDINDYSEDIDDRNEQLNPNVSFVESELDTQYHDMSIYDSINNRVPYNYIKKNKKISINYKLIDYIKEYCDILNYNFNTISSWKLEIPDDFTKYR